METNEQKNTEIFDAFQQLKALAKINSGVDMEQAKFFAYMKKDEKFKIVMGYPEATWRAFLAQPELQPIKVSKADRLAKIYNTYITLLNLKTEDIVGIDSYSLQRLANVVNTENVREWLDKAKNLSRSDLVREIKYGHIDEVNCQHQWATQEIKTCKLCGTKETKKISWVAH